MSSIDTQALSIIPRTNIGKLILGLVILALVGIGLGVFGVVFNEPRLIGPLPEVVFWVHLWAVVIHFLVIVTYFFLFRPWGESLNDHSIESRQSDTTVDEPEMIIDE